MHRYQIRYRDDSDESPIFSMIMLAYSKEHAEEKFYNDDDDDGWVLVSVSKLSDSTR